MVKMSPTDRKGELLQGSERTQCDCCLHLMCLSVSKMMESCLAGKPERVGPVEVDDIRRDLLGEFAALPAQVGPPVCLQCWYQQGPDEEDVAGLAGGSETDSCSVSLIRTVFSRSQRTCRST